MVLLFYIIETNGGYLSSCYYMDVLKYVEICINSESCTAVVLSVSKLEESKLKTFVVLCLATLSISCHQIIYCLNLQDIHLPPPITHAHIHFFFWIACFSCNIYIFYGGFSSYKIYYVIEWKYFLVRYLLFCT